MSMSVIVVIFMFAVVEFLKHVQTVSSSTSPGIDKEFGCSDVDIDIIAIENNAILQAPENICNTQKTNIWKVKLNVTVSNRKL